MKKAFLVLCLQVAIGGFQLVSNPPNAGLECYKCHKYDPNHPEDRCHIEHCHDDEFCEIDIASDNTVDGKCKHLNEVYKCLLDVQPMCIDYNNLVFFGKCRFCCGDANCVNMALNISDVPLVVTLPPKIPGTPDCVDQITNCATIVNICASTTGPALCRRFCNLCGGLPPVVIPPDAGLECYKCHKYDPDHPEDMCHLEHCHDDEFCQVDIGLDNTVDGKCRHRNELDHCLTDPQPMCNNYNGLFYGGCRFCCEDASCVNQAAGVSSVMTRPPSTTPNTPDCVDLVTECATTEDACSGTLALKLCKKSCNLCGAPSTTQITTSTTTTTTTITSTPTSILPPCTDLVKEHKCHTLPNICSDKLAGDICPEFCGLCQKELQLSVHGEVASLTHSLTQRVTPTVSLPICTSTTREDNCPLVPNVCSDRVAPYFCPEFCGLCTRQGKGSTPSDGTSKYSSATTVPFTTLSTANPVTMGLSTCSDHSPVCSSVTDICKRTFGLKLCEKTCRSCVSDNKTTRTTLTTTITPRSTTTTKVSSPTTTAMTSTTTLTTTSTPTSSTSTTYSSTRTTVMSTVTTTKAPSVVHRSCYQCGSVDAGTYCSLKDIYMPRASSCPEGKKFCMSDIKQNIDGTTNYIKRCVNKQQCEKLWYQQTSDISECVDMDPTSLMSSVTCRYCCTADNCNGGKVPAKQHLYKPTN